MTCKECIHYDVCKALEDEVDMISTYQCGCFKDKSKFIELPCKVGDTVYFANGKSIIETTIDKIGVRQSGLFIKLAKKQGL